MDEARVYLHGAPGAPAEASLFAPVDPDIFVPDRFCLSPGCDARVAFDNLACEIEARFAGRPIHLIGFSMGGYVALELAHRLKERVARIDLVSSAAPLEAGDFLPHMAGKALFTLALDKPRRFAMMVALQRLLAKFVPNVLFNLVFNGAVGADRMLRDDPAFKASIIKMLQSCFAKGAAGYAREIEACVQPWAHILPDIAPPVTLWHGSADNWAPVTMAKYLESALPNVERLEIVEGASHYSTLRHAMMRIYGGPRSS